MNQISAALTCEIGRYCPDLRGPVGNNRAGVFSKCNFIVMVGIVRTRVLSVGNVWEERDHVPGWVSKTSYDKPARCHITT